MTDITRRIAPLGVPQTPDDYGLRAVHAALNDPVHNPLEAIATLVMSLTYGDMLEMAAEILGPQASDFKPPTTPVEVANMLHSWAKRRQP